MNKHLGIIFILLFVLITGFCLAEGMLEFRKGFTVKNLGVITDFEYENGAFMHSTQYVFTINNTLKIITPNLKESQIRLGDCLYEFNNILTVNYKVGSCK